MVHHMQCNTSVLTTQYLEKSMVFGIQHNVSEHSSTMQFSSTMISYAIGKKIIINSRNNLKILNKSTLITNMQSNCELILTA